MKNSMVRPFLLSMLFACTVIGILTFTATNTSGQESVKAVEECVNNQTACLKCGGFCNVSCCNDTPVARLF